ncbi:MAG: ATP-binding protein [Bacteroidales bacterium]|nr:ATP-binding protein [Bacteroidales bacterium]
MSARILIAEDDLTSARLLEITLIKGGYSPIKIVHSGPDAVTAAAELNPDIVMMDINMPGEYDGIEAASRIFSQFRIPVVYITANTSPKIIERALNTSPMGYVLKPFNREMLFTMIEISLYKQKIENELSYSKNLIQSAMESLTEGVISIAEDRIRLVNQAARTILFVQHDDELNKPVNEIIRLKSELNGRIVHLDSILNGSKNFSGDFLLENLVGLQIPINLKAIKTNDQLEKSWVISIRDISLEKEHQNELLKMNEELERKVLQRTSELRKNNLTLESEIGRRQIIENELKKALEKEKEINDYKTNIVNTISHEFRTPITSIQSSAELMERTINQTDNPENSKLTHHINIIKRSVTSVMDLLTDVLLMSSINSDKPNIAYDNINPQIFFTETMQHYKDGIGRNHEIDFQHNDFPSSISTSVKLLSHIINNLMSNAFKYSKDQSLVLLVVVFQNKGMKITVKDQGIGIPSENLNHLFDAFYRGKNVVNLEGTGLGLAILQNSLNALNGSIQVSSILGEGSTFTVNIPYSRSDTD